MSGELRTSQFRYTVTPDDDFVVGSPQNSGLKTTKYFTFQVSKQIGFGANPHIRCEYSQSKGVWEIKFSNDGLHVTDFAYQNVSNNFTAANTFTGAVSIEGVGTLTVPAARLFLLGMQANSAVATDITGKHLVTLGVSAQEMSHVAGVQGPIQTQLNLKAPLDSPTLTGKPMAPTPALTTNDDQIATTKFVQQASSANIGLKGYDGRSIVFTDQVTKTNYRLDAYGGLLSVMTYSLPGTDYIVLKDISTGVTYKLSFVSGAVTLTLTDLQGVYSYTIYDPVSGVFHRMYLDNSVLKNRPE